jgi:hypothetical protein
MRRATALLALALFGLAACGGGGDGRLTASEYRSKADSICADANKKLNSLGTPSTAAELRRLLKKARPTLKNAIDRLEALEPPESLESKADEWNSKNEALLQKYDELSKEKDIGRLQQKGQELARLNDEANTYARTQLGLTDCASD